MRKLSIGIPLRLFHQNAIDFEGGSIMGGIQRTLSARRQALCVLFIIVTLISGGLTPNAATAATYYVATNGSDSNPGTEARPFRTINRGVSLLGPGDTLNVRSGTYAETLISNIPGGRSWSNPVTVAAFPGETVTLRPRSPHPRATCLKQDLPGCIYRVIEFGGKTQRYIIIDRFIIDAVDVAIEGIKIYTDRIRLKNLEIRNGPCYAVLIAPVGPGQGNDNELLDIKASNSGWDYDTCFGSPGDAYLRSNAGAFYINGASNTLVDRCEILGGPGGAISIYKDSYPAWAGRNNIIRNCKIYNNGTPRMRGGGINVSLPADPSAPGNLIYNNVIYNNRGSAGGAAPGVLVYGAGHNTKIYNNTIYNNSGEGIYISPNISGVVVQNNIVYRNSEPIVNRGVRTFLSNNFTGDPLFVDAPNGDFRLRSGSPAMNVGAPLR